MPRGVYARTGLAERFWAKVDRRGPGECWPWMGGRSPSGYGRVYVDGRNTRANRVALELHLGRPLAPGMKSCHSCDTPPCCNPAHLFEGTDAENVADKVAKGRQAAGMRNAAARLTPEIVRQIRSEYVPRAIGAGLRALASKYGVHHTTVADIVNGDTWKEVAS
jgi:hypothetical protein